MTWTVRTMTWMITKLPSYYIHVKDADIIQEIFRFVRD